MPVAGVEPARCHHQRILSPSRLPIPTHRLICCLYSILQACQKIKIYFALIFTSQIRSKSILDIPRIIGLSFFSARSVRQRSAWQSLLCEKSSAGSPFSGCCPVWGWGGPGGRSRFPKPSPVSLVWFCICARSTVGRMCKKSGC